MRTIYEGGPTNKGRYKVEFFNGTWIAVALDQTDDKKAAIAAAKRHQAAGYYVRVVDSEARS